MGAPNLVDGLYLVLNGVPFDVAFSFGERERLAWVVAIGTLVSVVLPGVQS